MAHPYSDDLRLRVMASLAEGVPVPELADRYGINTSTIYRWRRQRDTNGNLTFSGWRGGRPPKITAAQKERMIALLRQNPDMTLEKLQQHSHVPISLPRIWQILDSEGITLKKKHSSQLSRTA